MSRASDDRNIPNIPNHHNIPNISAGIAGIITPPGSSSPATPPLVPIQEVRVVSKPKKKPTSALSSLSTVTFRKQDSSTSTSNTLPSAVLAVLQAVRAYQRERPALSSTHWQTYSLRQEEYTILLAEVEKQDPSFHTFWTEKLRYSYLPDTCTFAIRMPSRLHDVFTKLVVAEIDRQLREIYTAHPTCHYIDAIEGLGSARITLNGQPAHDPDSSWIHTDALFPGVVLEVSYSQNKDAIKDLADHYILGSDGNIRVVVGLDIEYRKPQNSTHPAARRGTLSVWKPRFVTKDGQNEMEANQDIVDMEFCDENGIPNPTPDVGLHLHLKDFASECLHPTDALLPSDTIFLPAATLTRFLDRAIRRETISLNASGAVDPLPQNVQKRPRERTPEERIEGSRESEFVARERNAIKRAQKGDRSFRR